VAIRVGVEERGSSGTEKAGREWDTSLIPDRLDLALNLNSIIPALP
jgi:hypothetical protein